MKKMLPAFAAATALLILTGCCCNETKCPPKHRHTAECSMENCGEDKKNCSTQDNKTASNDAGEHNNEDSAVKETKLTSR